MRYRREPGAWARARKIAARALSGVALAEVGSATHFHTIAVAPAWGPQMRRVAQVGLHVFYRFNPRSRLVAKPAAPAEVEQAVMTSLKPEAGAIDLRLASAVVQKDAPPAPEKAQAPRDEAAPMAASKAEDAASMATPAAAKTSAM
jgi:hypothetical protein